MDLKSNFKTQCQWELYRNELRRAFHKIGDANGNFALNRDVRNILNKIDWRFSRISNEKVYLRQDRKVVLHQEKIERYRKEANELIDVLNENFVLEILLGD